MIKHLIKYNALIAAIFVLAPLIFWFSYSELGQLVGEKENAAALDYCEIVKVTKAETAKTPLSDLFKLKIEKLICLHCIDEISIHNISINKSFLEHLYSPQKTTEIYLFNRSFLI